MGGIHGLIFTSFRHYVVNRFGAERAREIWRGEQVYLITDAYPDEHLLDLVARTASAAEREPDEIVRDFGIFAAQTTFTLLYPDYFRAVGGTRPFLLGVESRIHELVRATIPDASPPYLHVEPLGPAGVRIHYGSPRRLCTLLEGLVVGTARHYKERADIEQPECMHRGDPACVFEARFRPL